MLLTRHYLFLNARRSRGHHDDEEQNAYGHCFTLLVVLIVGPVEVVARNGNSSPDAEITKLRPCDIYLTGGPSFIARVICYFSTSKGEEKTEVNHAGILVEGGSLYSAIAMDANAKFGKVRRHPLGWYAGKKSRVAIFRPLNLSRAEKNKIVAEAETYNNKPYGFTKIVAHFFDWGLRVEGTSFVV